MGFFSAKKGTEEIVPERNLDKQVEDCAYAIKRGSEFVLEKYEDVLREEVVIGKEIRNIQKNFADVVGNVSNLVDIIHVSRESIEKTAETAEQFQSVKDDITQSVAEAKTEINNLKESSEVTVASYEAMNRTFSALEQAVNDIKSCMEGIIKVANQTNLLSLNASIEAARAGEAGRGFAIVAEQVRQLSGEIKILVSNVEASIESVESSTVELNDSIQASKSAVEESYSNVDTTYAIVGKVESSAAGINEVYAALCDSVEESKQGICNIEEFVMFSQSAYDKVSGCIETINEHENQKGVMYEDMYNIIQQYIPLSSEVEKLK